jgi:CSLREA domain-containing protein
LQVEWLEDRVVPATFDVNTTADVFGGATLSLRNAIQAANVSPDASNTINILTAGTYAITLAGTPNQSDNAAGEFAINLKSGGSLTINNQSGGAVIVDAQNASRVFDINPGNTIFPAVAHVGFNGNAGGITVTNGRAAPTDDANGSGGDIRDQGPVGLTLNNVTVSNGTGGGDGGGISMENPTVSTPWTLTLNQSTVINNHAQDAGGGIDEDGTGTVNITNSLITGNSAVNQSGGIWLDAIGTGTANLNITQSVISNNFAGQLGAGFGNSGNGTVTVTNSTVLGNSTAGFGGGFADENNLGTLVVQNSLFQNNAASGPGGALAAGGPSTTITNSEFRGNFSFSSGGALFLVQNAGGTPASAVSTFTISNTTLANNNAEISGGGIEFATSTGSTSTATVTNSTIANNSALTLNGGGIDVTSGFTGSVTLRNSTITNNFAHGNGGGVSFAGTAGGSVSVQNTIIAANLAGGTGPDAANPAGNFTDLGNNLIGVAGAGSGNTGFGGTTQAGTVASPLNPLVTGLKNNGGPTAGVTAAFGAANITPAPFSLTVETEALQPISPAIGKGAAVAGLTSDQRGFPIANPPDVGAFQFQNAKLTITVTAPQTVGQGNSATITVTVNNTSGNALPAADGTVVVTLSAGLTPTSGGQTQTFSLGPIAANSSQVFTIPVTATQTGAQTITASVTSPDANPNTVNAPTVTVTVGQPTPTTPTPVGQLLVFGLGFVNGQLVLLFVDQKGQIFDENFSFNNFFSPDPANAVFLNTHLVIRNAAPTNIFGSPGIIFSLVDANGNANLSTTVPLNFIAAAALNDIITALQQP